MSRHREIKNMKKEDYDDSGVIGHSYEEHDMASPSPNTASQYLYRREGGPQEPEVSEKSGRQSDNYYEEDDANEDYFYELVDQVYNVVGDDFSEEEIIKALELAEENVSEAIDMLFGGVVKIPKKGKSKQTTSQAKQPPSKPSNSAPNSAKQTTSTSKSPAIKPTTPGKSPSSTPGGSSNKLTPIETTKSLHEHHSGSEHSTPKIVPQRLVSKTKEVMKEISEVDASGKSALNLVVCGHVDAGKSTLMGHMLFILGNVSDRLMHRYETDSKKAGKGSFAYAWVLDENEHERSRGVTIDVAISSFETPNRRITLLDAPGHRDFIPNMISGAAQADVAVLVVDATTGEFEAGFDSHGQTKEHALLIRSLGVTNVIVAVNKMDNAGWSKERFDEICHRLLAFMKQSGFKENALSFIPCSGLSGDNLKERKQLPWYSGPSIYEAIDTLPPISRPIDKPLRMAVTDFYRSMALGVTIAGRIESGVICVGDHVIVMPSHEKAVVKGIEMNKQSVPWARAGDNPEIGLHGIEATSLGIGHVICDPESLVSRKLLKKTASYHI
eukprot:TRINITY_DN5614_c0_g1_i2.p2 TRINITY_DN5614_c0_g1~~TRINITY_DN5614_c0_g1_i2.p2  ORF type:complete len:555 (+),score=121.19 TRINITY_DN5614_c0_g1_i2:57-1721(+)